jgi:hypothetical protein
VNNTIGRDLPSVQSFQLDEPQEGDVLEFRLLYKGPLPSDTGSGGRVEYKHRIRKSLHPQLRELWKQHLSLRQQAETRWQKNFQNPDGSWNVSPALPGMPAGPYGPNQGWIEHIADDHTACGARWVPLVSKVSQFTCSLDILFLRRDSPGGLVKHGGDVDNRIKTLLDGLRKPDTVSDLGGYAIDADENPFHVLLEDDRLITGFTVTTDRLLMPMESGDKEHWVELVLDVKIINPHALFVGNRLV